MEEVCIIIWKSMYTKTTKIQAEEKNQWKKRKKENTFSESQEKVRWNIPRVLMYF